MELRVSDVTAERIVCGPWEFDKVSGAEIDEDLGWDVNGTGSYLYHDGIGKTTHVIQQSASFDEESTSKTPPAQDESASV
jgi:hypothetical protein